LIDPAIFVFEKNYKLMNIACSNCCPDKCFICKFCSNESLKILNESKCIVRHKKGQYIFHEGNIVQGIYIINSGKVKVINTGFKGKTQIIRFAKAGHLLGHRGLGDKYYFISAVAIEDSTLCFIEKNTFTQLLKNDAQLTYHLMLFYAEELRIAETRMRNLAQMTVREKAVEALLLLKKTFGLPMKDGEILLDVLLNRGDIAELAGLSPEQITRCFSELRDEGVISMDNKRVTILQSENLYKTIAPYYPSGIFRESYSPTELIIS
jgi:CRP-like cAMP-binding protein